MPTDTYLHGLNAAQKEAVLHTEDPLLIIAGAGAGKTRTITHRIAHLMEQGIPGRSILAVTFTNKAAGEMRERVWKLAKEPQNGMPLLSTFHSLGVRILREFHKEAAVARNFSIWDRDDSIRAIKKVVDRLGLDISPKFILAAISREKGDGIDGSTYAEKARTTREQTIARVWDAYEHVLREEDALDFDDLLLRAHSLLSQSERTRSLLQNRFRYMMIDEYQDTNKVQMEIARFLAGEQKNICVVGDLDQCVYTWRNARLENLLEFEKMFPGTKVVTLEENYRSTRTILAAANAVIEKNVRRKPKKLFTQKETGEPIFFYSARNEIDEAWFVGQTAAQLIEKGVNPEEIAVLYRENFQSRVLEEAFLHLSVPYRVVGTRFFERKEVKDTLAYLRAALNPNSKSDIARIVGVPPRGIGKITLEKMFSGNEKGVPKSAQKKVAAFREMLALIQRAARTVACSEALRFTVEASGIERMLKKDDEYGAERIANIYELVNLATKYDSEMPPHGVEKLLEDAALQTEHDEIDQVVSSRDKNQDAVSLMTAHASKGLEFDAVFVTGLEQGLFPSERESDTLLAGGRDPEEERRLFYVAITRAGKRLYLSHACERMKYGTRNYAIPSEFLSDIDTRLIERLPSVEPVAEKIIE